MDVVKQDSRLLSLPTEIITQIIELAIGEQVLHVNLKRDADHGWRCFSDECPVFQGSGIYMTRCVAQTTERQAWEDFQTKTSHSVPKKDKAEYYVSKPSKRHEKCEYYQELDCRQPQSVPPPILSLFFVCRRLSIEAFPIFWATNTFSVGSWPIFVEFLKTISARSKRAIRAIDLDVIFHHDTLDPFDPVDTFHNEDIDVVDLDDLERLSDLETFNLSISSTMFTKLGFRRKRRLQRPPNLRKTFGRDVMRLEVLNIKKLNVIVYDDVKDGFMNDWWPWRRLTRIEKQKLAGKIYRILTHDARRQVLTGRDRQIREAKKFVRVLEDTQEREWKEQGLELEEPSGTHLALGDDAYDDR
ncbi:MAG: hypothetical protein Q9169_006475 [Polycauliona sp. 2 TL-2023]